MMLCYWKRRGFYVVAVCFRKCVGVEVEEDVELV